MEYATVPGAANGLLVNQLDTVNSEHDGLWKVSYVFEEVPHALPGVAFARRTDAERAKAALEPIINWTLSPDQVIEQLRQNGWTRQSVLQRMVESIQW
jgi:hypothetical protein